MGPLPPREIVFGAVVLQPCLEQREIADFTEQGLAGMQFLKWEMGRFGRGASLRPVAKLLQRESNLVQTGRPEGLAPEQPGDSPDRLRRVAG